MKAAIYAKVSTEDQEREGTSLESQREARAAENPRTCDIPLQIGNVDTGGYEGNESRGLGK